MAYTKDDKDLFNSISQICTFLLSSCLINDWQALIHTFTIAK